MGSDNRPRRNLFDVIAAWLSPGGEGRPGRLAQAFALLGTTFAVLQLFFSTLDLANRTLASLLQWFPYLVPIMLIAGAATSIYLLLSSDFRSQKRWASGALGLILVVSTGWGGWNYYQATRPPKAVIVLVADFDGRQARQGVDWGYRIYKQVKAQVESLDLDERVEAERVFEAYGSSEQARARGDARKATIVLWGWYDDLSVSPHFELLRRAEKFEAGLAAPPQDLMDFELYLQSGPQEMAYIVAVVLGLIQYAEGDYLAAEPLFTSALANAPRSATLLGLETPYLYRANARFLGYRPANRPMGDIVADLQEAISHKPELWQAHWNLALAYTNYCTPTLTLDAALAEAEKVRDLRPNDADAHWLLGQIYAERREWGQAQAAYREALRVDPGHVDSHESLAKALEESGQQEEARAEYQRALEIRQRAVAGKPQDPAEAQDRLGYAYLNAGQYDQAIAAFQEALRRQPNNADYHRHLGNAYYWQGKASADAPSAQLDLAIAEYEAARRLAPDDSLLLTVLGGAYKEAGRPEDALRAYEDAVKAAPCDDEALFLLASQYEKMEREADAEAAFKRLVQLNPRQAVGWQALATAAFLREDYAAAADAYRAAVAVAPQDADLYRGLGASLYYLGDYQGAEEAYRQAKTLAPEDASALARWADSLAKLGRTDEAIAAYEKAVELEPETPLYRFWLGLLYEQQQRWPEAASAFAKAAELQPQDALAHAAHGRVLQRMAQYGGAAAAYEQAVKYEPDSASYWESLMLSYGALNRLDDALRAAEETLKRNPESVMAYLVRGGIYEDRGEKEKARADYQRVLELAGDNTALKQAAQAALQRLGD